MEEELNLIEDQKKFKTIYDEWLGRNPRFEIKHREGVVKYTCDWMKGTNSTSDAKNKVLGAGYETFIMAFFIGLYADQRRKLSSNTDDLDTFHWSISHWGEIEERNLRHRYPSLRKYIFIACVARTDVDWIALEKGELKSSKVVSELIHTMEEYANYGYEVMSDKLDEDKFFFFDNHSYLDLFRSLTDKKTDPDVQDIDAPESLD